MSENLSTRSNDSIIQSQVWNLESMLASAENSLLALRIASDRVVRDWMSQEPHELLAMSQRCTESLIEFRRVIESISGDEFGVIGESGAALGFDRLH